MCYVGIVVETVGLRELQQHASDVVRRAEAGAEIVVTVNGREAARLMPPTPPVWRSYEQVARVLAGPGAPSLAHDLAVWDDEPVDPFTRRG